MKVPSRTTVTLTAGVVILVGGCTHPCAVLEERVCVTAIDETRCELIQDPDRRDLLTRETCDGILEAMDERR